MGGHNLKLLLIAENNLGVTLSYVIRKDTPSPDDGENRGNYIIHPASLVVNMYTRISRKVFDILK